MFFAFSYLFFTKRRICIENGLDPQANICQRLIYKVCTINKAVSLHSGLRKKSNFLLLALFVVVYLLTTEIFSGVSARVLWHGKLLSFQFLISSALSGLAVILIIFFSTEINKNKKVTVFLAQVKNWFLALIVVDLILIILKYFFDLNNPLIPRLKSIFPYSLIFFAFIGNVIPFGLVFFRKNKKDISKGLEIFIPTLVLTGLLAKRLDIIVSAYLLRWLPFAPSGSYVPGLIEIIIVLGVYSGAAMFFICVYRYMRRYL